MTPQASKTKTLDAIHDTSTKLAKAQERVRKLTEQLEDDVAAAVTSAPWHKAWYMRPGIVTPEEVLPYAGMTETTLHNAMQRQRVRAVEQRRKQVRVAKSAKRRNTGKRLPPTEDPNEPIGF